MPIATKDPTGRAESGEGLGLIRERRWGRYTLPIEYAGTPLDPDVAFGPDVIPPPPARVGLRNFRIYNQPGARP